MIEITGLNKTFGKNWVLKDVNLTLEKGECIALVGHNGCGKTTLVKTILGMVLPDCGSISLNGESILGKFQYRKNIGYMPQIGRYPDNMTVKQIIDIVKEIRNQNIGIDEEFIEKFDIKKIYGSRMCTLSGGTIQKVSAVLAFLFDPDILILDEPTAGLDILASEILKEKIIREKKSGKLILITSHILSEFDDMVTQIIFMQGGNVLFHRTIEDLLQSTGEQKISKAITKIIKT